MNILILTGKFGMGHWSASQSLRQQLLNSFPDINVDVEDFLTYAVPNLAEAMYKGFNMVVTYGSPLFNVYYKLTAKGHSDARPPFEGLLLDKLAEMLYERRPDAVIATHPLCAQLVSRLKEEARRKGAYGLDLPLITCVTDVSSHPEWINRNTDCYMVASREVRQELVEKGVDPSLVCVTGIPVREEFRHLGHCEMGKEDVGGLFSMNSYVREYGNGSRSFSSKCLEAGSGEQDGDEENNHSLAGDKERKVWEVLIMGGGLGLLPKSTEFYDSLNAIPDTHVTIITGRNRKLLKRLQGRWENIQVMGYTSQVWEFMSRADLIVTKPGGITLFETIFAQVPVLTWPPTLQQEKGNARWLAEEGIGWIAGKKNCAGEIREILKDDKRLSNARNRMGELKGQLKAESLDGVVEVIARSEYTSA